MALFQKGRDAGFGIVAVQKPLQPIQWTLFIFHEGEQKLSGKGNKSTPQEEGKPGRGHCFAL